MLFKVRLHLQIALSAQFAYSFLVKVKLTKEKD
ncbi:hypothetical protein AN214_04002 [Pseudoalteromonas sp. P1-9]|nr:hypothetical protein AN214_04002 [Pseudoalteromonas sp. P1-9]